MYYQSTLIATEWSRVRFRANEFDNWNNFLFLLVYIDYSYFSFISFRKFTAFNKCHSKRFNIVSRAAHLLDDGISCVIILSTINTASILFVRVYEVIWTVTGSTDCFEVQHQPFFTSHDQFIVRFIRNETGYSIVFYDKSNETIPSTNVIIDAKIIYVRFDL